MDIRACLKENPPLLFDGAMGTWYAARPGSAEKRCELANLLDPKTILGIHRAYLSAGCRAIKTNTFSVGTDMAAGDISLARDLITAACQLALDAARPFDAFVFADMGPAPEEGNLSPAENYRQQAEWFLSQGVTCFLLETLPSDEGIPELARYLKSRCRTAFLIVSYAAGADGMTRTGHAGRDLFLRTASLPEIDAVGFNCVTGPQHLLEYVSTLPLDGVTLSVMPNAGYPTVLGRRVRFGGTPDYFGGKLAQIAGAGASIVGGCCGTTPDHIAAARAALRSAPARTARPGIPVSRPAETRPDPVGEKLSAGKRLVAVELDPPIDDNAAFFFDGVRAIRDAGADMITISDCPVGRPRADSSLLACKIRRELGIEPLPHMACRDRNLNAVKALLLGLSIEGVRNVLLVTGDPVPTENRDEVKSVFNFNSRKLARYVRSLNGTALHTPFRVFAALNVNARNFDRQLELAREKEECGVSGFLTQPVLSPEALEHLKQARAVLNGYILGGILPIVSYRNACFLNNEIAGIRVSPEIIAQYEGKSRDEAEQLAADLSCQTAREIAPYTDGLYLMTPFKRVSLVTEILGRLREKG